MHDINCASTKNTPHVVSFINTKGGGGKSTLTANTVGFLADAGLRVLGIDLDTQPSFTSYYQLTHEVPGGIYELLLNRDTRPDAVISQTNLPNFHLIKSNNPHDQLKNHLLAAPDGRLRLKQLIAAFSEYDAIVIDTQGRTPFFLKLPLLPPISSVVLPFLPFRMPVSFSGGPCQCLLRCSRYIRCSGCPCHRSKWASTGWTHATASWITRP